VKALHLTLSDAAVADILEQYEWYEEQSGEKLAKRWEKAVTSTLLRISRRPGTGSPCKFSSAELRGTRRAPISGFPRHLVFYLPYSDEIVVLRIVHGARDLETLFSV
jgi:toxin ParE1/3/4